MIKLFKIYEEIKRKVPEDFNLDDVFLEGRELVFRDFEIELLEADDFVVSKDVAVCEETNCTFIIEKSAPDYYTIMYDLTIFDKLNNKKLNRKLRIDTLGRMRILNAILNICAKYNDNLKKQIMKDIDPYGEEKW